MYRDWIFEMRNGGIDQKRSWIVYKHKWEPDLSVWLPFRSMVAVATISRQVTVIMTGLACRNKPIPWHRRWSGAPQELSEDSFPWQFLATTFTRFPGILLASVWTINQRFTEDKPSLFWDRSYSCLFHRKNGINTRLYHSFDSFPLPGKIPLVVFDEFIMQRTEWPFIAHLMRSNLRHRCNMYQIKGTVEMNKKPTGVLNKMWITSTIIKSMS